MAERKHVLPPGSGGCSSGKLQFSNRKQAKQAISRIGDKTMRAYHCVECGWIHMGHAPKAVANGTLDKKEWLNR